MTYIASFTFTSDNGTPYKEDELITEAEYNALPVHEQEFFTSAYVDLENTIINIELNDIKLEMTCGACPEQYEATYNGDEVGYLRLRHGYFYVSFPGVRGEVIYEAYPEGDGIFEDNERDLYLNEAKQSIIKKLLS